MGNIAPVNNAPEIRRVLFFTLILNSGVSLAKKRPGFLTG